MAFKPFRKYRKTLILFVKQNGLCWICGCPMLLPRQGLRNPGRWEANIDHIGQKCGRQRTLKAAHAGCNLARGHKQPCEIEGHVNGLKAFFSDANRYRCMSGVTVEQALDTAKVRIEKITEIILNPPVVPLGVTMNRVDYARRMLKAGMAYHPDMPIEKL